MKKMFLVIVICSLVLSCSSRKLKREYSVVDSSHQDIPEWIKDYDDFLEDSDTKKFNYYKYETGPKNNREIACKIAKAQASSHVAGEISTKVKDLLTSSTEGDASQVGGKLDEYVSNTMTMDIESRLKGLKVVKTYWEKRAYAKERGALKDYRAWSCSVLLKISKKNVKKAMTNVETKLMKLVPNAAKENVQKMLQEGI